MERIKRAPTWLWLAGLLILAAVLRLPTLNRESLWFDEAISLLTARLPVSAILSNAVQSSHPPLYYALLHIWLRLAPATDLFARLPGVLFGLLLVPALYALTQDLFGRRDLALLSAALVAISPFHLLYSHELRMYTLLMLLVTWTVWAYRRARHSRGWGRWLIFTALGVASVYTHLFAWLALIAIGLHALIHHRQRHALWQTAAAGLAMIVLFTPWLRLMLLETQKNLGSMRPLSQETAFNPLKTLIAPAFLLFGSSFNPWYTGLILFVTVSLGIVLILEARKARMEKNGGGLLLPGLLTLCLLGGPLLVYYVRPFFLPERTLAAASPFLLVLLAWGVTRRGSPLPWLVGATAALMGVGAFLYLGGPPIKPPYRQAVAIATERWQPGDVVLHTSDGSFLPALCYAHWPAHAVLAGDPDPRKPDEVYRLLGGQVWTRQQAVRAGRRLWLIVALEHSLEWQQEQAAWFTQQYRLKERYSVGGIEIFLCELNGDAP